MADFWKYNETTHYKISFYTIFFITVFVQLFFFREAAACFSTPTGADNLHPAPHTASPAAP
jgi:hypothetical protein